MLEPTLRERLESLNRAPLPPVAARPYTGPSPANLGNVRPLPHCKVAAADHPPSRSQSDLPSIVGLLSRGEVVGNSGGEHLRIVLPLDELWPGGERLVRLRHAHLAATRGSEEREFAAFVAAFPGQVIFIDLETCGLGGSALFLVGLLRTIDSRLTVELLLARNYGEEQAVLVTFWQRLETATSVIATFNGKSFDWPMLVDRSRRYLLHRDRQLARPRHVDLLHAARRRWKADLPDCRLQTLELHVCGRRRRGDIPGRQIPAAYQEFVRTGFAREMNAILLHNAADLATMLDLAMRLA